MLADVASHAETIAKQAKYNNDLREEVEVSKGMIKSLKELCGLDDDCLIVNETPKKTNTVREKTSNPKEIICRCDECDQNFKTSKDLENHNRVKHDLDCPLCEKTFSSNKELKKHLNKCTDGKTEAFTCNNC